MPEIFIKDRRIRQFDDFKLTRSIDNVGDTFSFTCPFFPDTAEYRELFRPFSYHPVKIKINDRLIFTGTVELVAPNVTPDQTSVSIQGRSKTGVIIDTTFEKADFPIQFTKANLQEITDKLLSKYDIGSRFFDDPGPIFEEAGPQSPQESVFSFIQNLARQRQFLISQTEGGALLFWQANIEGKPVANLIEGQQGLTLSGATYNGSLRYQKYEVFGQEYGKNDNFSSIEDPALDGVTRPKAGQANNSNAANIVNSAAWAATSAIAQSINIPLELENWTRPDGVLWDANEIILLQAPSIMIYKSFPFLITSVSLEESNTVRKTVLNLTVPGAYSGKLPATYPWED